MFATDVRLQLQALHLFETLRPQEVKDIGRGVGALLCLVHHRNLFFFFFVLLHLFLAI